MTIRMQRKSSGPKSTDEDKTSRRRRTGGTGLNDFFIGVFGLCFVCSVTLNFIHADNIPSHLHDTAVKSAIEDFKQARKTGPLLEKGKEKEDSGRRLAELNCEKWGGPSLEAAQEMVYWEDIPSDASFVSPFCREGEEKFMTFEPDGGGWNNIRMAMESTIGLAYAMCRTLVMPPEKRMYLLGQGGKTQKHHFSFADFFPIEEMANEHKGLKVISMKEYLETQGLAGKLRNATTGEVEFPPENRTEWNGIDGQDYDVLKGYLRSVSETATWNPGQCLPAFPSSGDHKDVEILQNLVKNTRRIIPSGIPLTEVDDPNPMGRLEETLAGRRELCVYDERMQNLPIVHFQCNHKKRLRMLVHFYAFLFFENWKEDLWMKRFVRDHLHYVDEIQCAAARVVAAIRDRVRKRDPQNKNGDFDTFHIRRGDFQFKTTRIDADEIYENSKDELQPNSTIFIATDERTKSFFDPLRAHYDLVFLDDFQEELKGVNTNYFGMIDQLVASRGRVFFGCFFSTFTGYIIRIRGYHSVKDKAPGYKEGTLNSTYYYATKDKKFIMHQYSILRGGFFNREYPTSWRDINKGIGL